MNITNYESRTKSYLKKIKESKTISEVNKKLVLEYVTIRMTEVTAARMSIICGYLYYFLPFSKNLLEEMHESNKLRLSFSEYGSEICRTGKPRSKSTIKTTYNAVRTLCRFYNDDETPKGIKRIKIKGDMRRNLEPCDMWTKDDVRTLSGYTLLPVDKGLLIQYEAGLRPSELLGLNCGDIIFRNDGWATIKVNGTKNKLSKRLRHINWTLAYLLEWKHFHPNWKPDSPLFVDTTGNRMKYGNVRKRLNALAKRARINKPSDIYVARHSAVLLMKKSKMPSSLAPSQFGHSGRIYDEVYGRLSVEDNLDILKSLN